MKYGNGNYGVGAYGGLSNASVLEADFWSLDAFGDYLVGVFSGDGLFRVWEGNADDPMIAASASVTNPPVGSAPTNNRGVVVTPERFVFVLGANRDLRLVKWPSQETYSEWTPTAENSAGEVPLSTTGRIMTGRRAKEETLIWTDADLWRATYIGGTLIYAFSQVANQCGLVAPNAVAMIGNTEAMWMRKNGFSRYNGFVEPVTCDVHDYVFNDINVAQIAKAWAQTISEFSEVWWFYPSATSMECDRAVVYNYRENTWNFHRLSRTAGVDVSPTEYPVMVKPTGELMEHEVGDDREGEVPYVESGPVKLGEGDQVVDVLGFIPDEHTLGDVEVSVYAQFEPMGEETLEGPFTPTENTDARFSARQLRMRLTEVNEKSWRVGDYQLLVSPAGFR